MALKILLSYKINKFLSEFDRILSQILRNSLGNRPDLIPVLNGFETNDALEKPKFNLKDILNDGFTWYCPTPKHRTSAEKKLTKKFAPFPNNFITKYSRPKTNIMTCLDCGSHHEIGTICTKCYEEVKTETKIVQEHLLNNDKLRYEYPTKELEVVYKNDDQSRKEESERTKIVIKLDKERPTWFSKNLYTKVTTK